MATLRNGQRVIWRQETCRRHVVTFKDRPARLLSVGRQWSHIVVQKRSDPTQDQIRRVRTDSIRSAE